jgi:hypothetical protein
MFDIATAVPIPNPSTPEEVGFNEALAEYRRIEAEAANRAKFLAALERLRTDPEELARFRGLTNQLMRGHVSDVERREFAWLTKQVATAATPEKRAKAEAKLTNWRRSHAAAAALIEHGA